ncbi:small conductance mechanosensitive channel [Caldanaerobius fijiensis DSM 17918]|uniref:Small conductance mechanosensitive channel n=1 Tax=Caldanaerobius fijiensis DSM 17918 TaxID=1121256 RepID=A0A1M5AR50_9THEO|nr:mechanosensitive ion channel family protein [Caldanaerobius fijiensis]SHF32636.1 small conductance mechanosensitive channel [Caldanaerobius fijiensis DSM 17918]
MFNDIFLNIPQKWIDIMWIAVKIIVAFIVTRLTLLLLYKAVDKFFRNYKSSKFNISERKIKTMGTLVKNISKYVIYFIFVTIVLSFFNIKIESLLTVAGIGGLAVGFGAQSLVKDVITGFFILFEDQFGVGDYITVDKYSGIVEEVGLRVTKIRDFSGAIHIIPNGQITSVTNHNAGNMRALVEISVAYKEDLDKVQNVLQMVCDEVREEMSDKIVDGPTVLGVSGIGSGAVNITIVAIAKPMKHWEVERELRLKIKEAFDKEGIEMPYNKVVIYNEGKEGC